MMSTSPHFPLRDISSQDIHSRGPMVANGVGSGEVRTNEGDDRSSSLSDIEDRTANTELAHASHNIRSGSEANDTEAETERLEDSPQKVRKHTNVVLSSSSDVYHESANVVECHVLSANDSAHRSNLGAPDERGLVRETDAVDTRIDQTSDISSLEDSGEEIERLVSPSRKRRRGSPRSESRSEDERIGTVLMGKIQSASSHTRVHSDLADKGSTLEAFYADNDLVSGIGKREYTDNGVETTSLQHLSPSKSKSKKGKRKGKKTKDEDPDHSNIAISYTESQVEHFDRMVHLDSNGEDAEMEDVGDGAEADVVARSEAGLVKKKSAMDSLGAIEKCFATLRDKLFDERLGQYNDELAMLNQPIPNHPEYLAQKEVIDRYRDDKTDYEETLFKYKLTALQRKSIAEKAQIHSQYMQTVREIRDRNLEQLNKEWYQIQRERRNCEENEPDYMYKFPTRRSQQIRQQTAYNTEVSILSGVAKYVGFPAAPDIMGARPSEIDDDLAVIAAAMGPSGANTQASHGMQRQPSALRANSSSATAGFPRQKPAAEERFLEQTPWANPQHPAHHQQHHSLQRQMSNLSRPASPFSTPVGQRRAVDLNLAHGSASTIAEPQSGPSSSMAPTPITGEQMVKSGRLSQAFLADSKSSTTPSRLIEKPSKGPMSGSIGPELPNDKFHALPFGITERSGASSSLKNPSQNVPKDIPKLLPLKEGMPLSSPSNLPTSLQIQYPVIKDEESTRPPRRSPALNHYEPPDSRETATNGQQERLGV